MNYSFHNHTTRCHHAKGTPEEYIQRAIENGIKYMGFSDHAPYICSNGQEASYRVPVAEAADYFTELQTLRVKYADQIDLKIGFEMEYYPDYFEKMLQQMIDLGAEYLILGQHFLTEEYPDNHPCSKETTDPSRLHAYVDRVTDAMKSGAFSYVAHPDILRFAGDPATYCKEMTRLCEVSSACEVPIELNFLGIRESRWYPRTDFWSIAAQTKAPVTFGFDAHDVLNAYDSNSLEKALQMVEKFGLNYIGMPNLINPKHARIYK